MEAAVHTPFTIAATYLHQRCPINPADDVDSDDSCVDGDTSVSTSSSNASTVLEWNRHGEFLTNTVADFFRRGYQVDTSVIFGGERLAIGVHRLLMAAFLPTFKRAVDASDGHAMSELNLDGVAKNIEDVRTLLEFIYTGRATVSDHRLDHLSRLAKELSFEGLSDAIAVHYRRTSNIDATVKEEPYFDDEDEAEEQLNQLKPDEIVVKMEPADCYHPDDDESTCSSDDNSINLARDRNRNKPSDPPLPLPMIPADLCSVIINADYNTSSTNKKPLNNNSCTLCCELCGMKFKNMWDVRIHFQSNHPTDKLYECSKCNFHAITELGMYSHVVTTHKSVATAASGKLACDKCGKEFTLRSSLLRHLTNVHDIRKPYPCPRCPQSFVSVYYLADHVKIKHPDYRLHAFKDIDNVEPPVDDPDEPPPIPLATQPSSASGSTAEKVPMDNENSSSNDGSDCDLDEVLPENEFHQQQTDDHDSSANGFQCDRCGQEFTKSSSLRRHVACVHDRRKPFTCQLCTRKFARNCALRKHMSRKHKDSSSTVANSMDNDGEESPTAVIIEPAPTIREQPLNFHVAKFSCQLCDKDYALPGSLRRHVRSVHEGHAPYRCDQCPMAFTRNSFLRYHVKQKHAIKSTVGGTIGTLAQLNPCRVCKKPADLNMAANNSSTINSLSYVNSHN